MEAIIDCAAEVFGGKEALKAYPRMLTIMNINTPLQLDVVMSEVLLTLAKNGQPLCRSQLRHGRFPFLPLL